MKKQISFLLVLASTVLFSQVGVNTTAPTATLDIVAKNDTGAITTVDGLLIPRVDRQRAQSMSGVPTSTLIYINSIATGNQTGTAVSIDAEGYYYYNGNIWSKLNVSSTVNLYNADGALTGDRTVTQNANILAFTASAINAFSVDGSTFSVDAANNRVGIGTTAPVNRLDLGTIAGSSVTDAAGKKLAIYNNAGGTDFYGLGINSGILQFHAASIATEAPGMVLNSLGNVGIGNTAPTSRLEVTSGAANTSGLKLTNLTSTSPVGPGQPLGVDASGNVITVAHPNADINIYNDDGTLIGNRTVTQNANTLAFIGTATNAFSVDGSTLSVDAANNRIGIRTTAPNNTLDLGTIIGSSATDVTGKKLAIYNSAGGNDFYGLGINSGILQFHAASTSSEAPGMVLGADGRVGIGTVTASSNLSVNGTADKPGGGTWGTFSDRRVKKDIKEFTDGLNIITQLKPVIYKYNEKSGYTNLNKEYIGFIAQEVEKAAPYMVSTIDDHERSGLRDKKEFDESALAKILVNAIQQQQKQIEVLKLEIEKLRSKR